MLWLVAWRPNPDEMRDAALEVVGVKMRHLDAEITRKHYVDLEERLGKEIYDPAAGFMQTGPVIALALQGVDAVATAGRSRNESAALHALSISSR
jgi:nucleoside diphosphate kinase